MKINTYITGLILNKTLCFFTMADTDNFTGYIEDQSNTDYLVTNEIGSDEFYLVSRRDVVMLCDAKLAKEAEYGGPL